MRFERTCLLYISSGANFQEETKMAREGSLFIGRLSKTTRTRDVEEVFEAYGRMTRCEVKYGLYY